MQRRTFLLGSAALAAGGALWLRPGDAGGPYPAYFAQLNALLRAQGPGRPLIIIDRERLGRNCARVKATLAPGKAFRVVAKSLPSLPLLQEVMGLMDTQRLMVFHQPHLNTLARALPQSDLLLGKPMPVNAAATFYRTLGATAFQPARQLQWLIDSPERLQEYLQLAQTLGTKLRVNLEIDVGLHRGGLASPAELKPLLALMAAHPAHLEFSGFMGYDPHVGKIPGVIESRDKSFAKACAAYRAMQDALFAQHPDWRGRDLTFNGAGSPTLRLHDEKSPLNEVAAGSCLVKPADFDLDLLADLEPAAFIATPVLKVQRDVTIPGIEGARRLLSAWNPNQQRSYFIYGGLWLARYEAPPGLFDNGLYGRSSNQAIVTSSAQVPLRVNDHIFLRPTQSERVLLDFGDLAVVEDGRISAWWPALPA
ncbi:MAG: Alanine racemase domain protein [Moraxellaceae bacterium]|jgi:D-serine deaminase-like pyridoxal phosphate-dependent protein|nr:Alanine racemase domain protein [Moraxellaceae bacterium]